MLKDYNSSVTADYGRLEKYISKFYETKIAAEGKSISIDLMSTHIENNIILQQ